jgi:hypothetical protein
MPRRTLKWEASLCATWLAECESNRIQEHPVKLPGFAQILVPWRNLVKDPKRNPGHCEIHLSTVGFRWSISISTRSARVVRCKASLSKNSRLARSIARSLISNDSSVAEPSERSENVPETIQNRPLPNSNSHKGYYLEADIATALRYAEASRERCRGMSGRVV